MINKIILTYLLVGAFSIFISGFLFRNFFETINIVLIVGTLYWLLRYTYATEDMKKQMIRQNNFAQRPIINLYFRPVGQNRLDYNHFAIRNVGNAPAYNISIEDVRLDEFWFAFDIDNNEFNNVILEKEGDEKPIIMMGRTFDRGKLTYKNEAVELFKSKFNLLTDYNEQKYKESERRFAVILIKYKGLDGRNFYSIFKLYQKHPSVTDRIIEFIKTEEGTSTTEEAHILCQKIPKSKSIVEKMYS